MDPKSFTAGAVAGWLVSELGKQAISFVFKRSSDRSAEKKKMIRGELGELEAACLEITNLSLEYYELPSDSENAIKISRKIKSLAREVGVKLTTIGSQIVDLGIGKIEFRLWYELKRATGDQLDVRRSTRLPADDPKFDHINKACMGAYRMLYQLKHKCI